MHICNWYHSHVQAFIMYTTQVKIYMARSPCLSISPCWSPLLPLLPLLPFPIPFYLLGTLLAVTGSVHLGLRLLVNWPSLTQPFPKPSPSKFPEPKLPSASLRRPQDEFGVFCPEQLPKELVPSIKCNSNTWFLGESHYKPESRKM